MRTPVVHADLGGSRGVFVPTSFAAVATLYASPPAILYDVPKAASDVTGRGGGSERWDPIARVRRVTGWPVGVVVLVGGLGGCASAPTAGPRQMKPEDFQWLAGQWRGSWYVQGEPPAPIEAVIDENGSFFTVLRGAPGAQAPGQMRVVDAGVVYETPTSTSAMTFQEAGAEWLWKWQGKTRTGDRAVTNELRKAK